MAAPGALLTAQPHPQNVTAARLHWDTGTASPYEYGPTIYATNKVPDIQCLQLHDVTFRRQRIAPRQFSRIRRAIPYRCRNEDSGVSRQSSRIRLPHLVRSRATCVAPRRNSIFSVRASANRYLVTKRLNARYQDNLNRNGSCRIKRGCPQATKPASGGKFFNFPRCGLELTVTVKRRFRVRTRHYSRHHEHQALACVYRLQSKAWQHPGASLCHGPRLRSAAALIQTVEGGRFNVCPHLVLTLTSPVPRVPSQTRCEAEPGHLCDRI